MEANTLGLASLRPGKDFCASIAASPFFAEPSLASTTAPRILGAKAICGGTHGIETCFGTPL